MADNAASLSALVTGGAQGIGRAIALAFLKDDMNVLIADRDEDACTETAAALSQYGRIIGTICDVSVEEDVQKAIHLAIDRFGRIDVLICNAGITGPAVPLEQLTLEQWRTVIDVNLTGTFLFAKHAAPYLRKTRGCIINIASTRALQSEPDTAAYTSSKGGIVALTHQLAVSLGPDVRVNCISPGWIETAEWQKHANRTTPVLPEQDHLQHPAGRVGTPEDVASLAAYLASPKAGFITGQNFVVDGGMTRKMIYVE